MSHSEQEMAVAAKDLAPFPGPPDRRHFPSTVTADFVFLMPKWLRNMPEVPVLAESHSYGRTRNCTNWKLNNTVNKVRSLLSSCKGQEEPFREINRCCSVGQHSWAFWKGQGPEDQHTFLLRLKANYLARRFSPWPPVDYGDIQAFFINLTKGPER